jgi:DNA-binding transcriptional MerR regulator
MDLMTIGAFSERTRLSAKALRLYDRLGLVRPARTDPASGYRFYREDQVDGARLVALLRRLGMPLPVIADVLRLPAGAAAEAIGGYWAEIESATAERRVLVSYIQARLAGGDMARYDIQTRTMPRRTLVAVTRHVHADEAGPFFGASFARLRAAGPGIEGIAGCPFVVYYGEVSEDSDGPVELCRPVAADHDPDPDPDLADADVQARTEPSHEEVFIRVAMKDMGWPALAPAVDALEDWGRDCRRAPACALRQVLIADQRTAEPDTPVCDLSVPLRLLVPCLDAGLADDQAVFEVEDGYAQDPRAARVTAVLDEGRVVVADHEALDLVGHVPPAHVGEVLADRGAAANDLGVAGLIVPVDDVQFGVLGVQAEEGGGVALLDAAPQCLRVERLARMAADRGDGGQHSDRGRLRGHAHRSRPPARELAGGARE